jgi:hypothetical protein
LFIVTHVERGGDTGQRGRGWSFFVMADSLGVAWPGRTSSGYMARCGQDDYAGLALIVIRSREMNLVLIDSGCLLRI